MSFVDLADIVGGLPPSAYVHRQWWENDNHHVQAMAWRAAGMRVGSVDLERRRVVFVRE